MLPPVRFVSSIFLLSLIELLQKTPLMRLNTRGDKNKKVTFFKSKIQKYYLNFIRVNKTNYGQGSFAKGFSPYSVVPNQRGVESNYINRVKLVSRLHSSLF